MPTLLLTLAVSCPAKSPTLEIATAKDTQPPAGARSGHTRSCCAFRTALVLPYRYNHGCRTIKSLVLAIAHSSLTHRIACQLKDPKLQGLKRKKDGAVSSCICMHRVQYRDAFGPCPVPVRLSDRWLEIMPSGLQTHRDICVGAFASRFPFALILSFLPCVEPFLRCSAPFPS